jgi:catechol 2,3-dioxygenase-like lactoylglutathione lyase family enzyme
MQRQGEAPPKNLPGMGAPAAPGWGVRWTGVCLDCADAEELAGFYSRLLGWPVTARDGSGWVQIRDPEGGVSLNFQAETWYERPVWPEAPGAPAKMLHFEIEVEDVKSAVADAIGAGARLAVHQPPNRDPSGLRVMLDPAGHPFCLFRRGD